MVIYRFVSIFLVFASIVSVTFSKAGIDQEKILSTLQENSEAVVLIYSVNTSAPKDQKIYNLTMQPRKTKQQCHVGVFSGIVLSEDGYIVVPSSCVKYSSEIIVSVNSEFRARCDTSDLKLTENDYKAKIVKDFPKRNIAILKIKPKQKLKFIKVGFNSDLINSENGIIRKFCGVIGKAKAGKFMTLSSPLTTKNNFDKFFSYINAVQYKKHRGAPILIARGAQASNAFLAETNGGAVLDENGKLIGMVLCNYFDSTFPIECAIPVDEIKECVRIAGINLPYMSQNFDNIGVEVSDMDKPIFSLGIGDSELEALKIQKKEEEVFGVKIDSVTKGSRAESASLLPGDIVILIGDDIVFDVQTFRNLEARLSSNTTFKVIRENKVLEIEI